MGMSVATADGAVPESSGTGGYADAWTSQLVVLLIEQGRELCNALTELPAPVGDGRVHGGDPICPQDPGTVHAVRPWSELSWLLEQTLALVEDLVADVQVLAGERPVAGLGPVLAIASRWVTATRGMLMVAGRGGPGAATGVVAA